MKTIYELELFEEKVLYSNDAMWESLKRVPGGWLYLYKNNNSSTCAFIPYDHEFKGR